MITPNPFRFAWAVLRSFWRFVRGQRVVVPDRISESRLSECRKPCEFLIGDQCRLCTCFVDMKTLFADESCQARKWPKWYPELDKSKVPRTSL